MTEMDQAQRQEQRSDRGRALYWVGAVLLALLLADQLIAFGVWIAADEWRKSSDSVLSGRSDLEALLARAVETEGRTILLLGDSVLAGDVLASRRASWSSKRIVDALRSHAHPDADATFYQIALNGLLPVDMRQILRTLNQLDPQGQVEIVAEINLRYFSSDYTESGCSREWLCEISEGAAFSLFDFLRANLPVWRHRRVGEELSLLPSVADVARGVRSDETDELAGLARVQGHYRVDLDQESQQFEALKEIAASLQKHARRGVFFATPLSDAFANALYDEGELGELYADLARALHDAGSPQSRFVSFDHPLFDDSLFVDQVHLTAVGNRLLAINLLAELGIRLERAPRRSDLLYDHAIERTLVSTSDRGRVNGPGWMARFDSVGGIAFDPSSQQLFVAEPGNHTLRRLRGGMRSVESFTGVPGQAGSRDGKLEDALFDSPRSPVVSDGVVYLIDGRGTRLRSISAGRVSTPVTTAVVMPGSSFVELAANKAGLFVLDGNGAIHLLRDGELMPQVGAPKKGKTPIHFTVSAAGEVFVTDGVRILRGMLPAANREAAILPFESLEVMVSSTGSGIMPESGSRFPIPFDELRFSEITALVYVERYRALLVMDSVSLDGPNFESPATERAHFRLLEPETRQAYPWLKAYVNEHAQFPAFFRAKNPGSAFHLADLALDPTTLDLYLLEKHRSRLIRIGDGIYGTSRVSDSEAADTSPFGARSSREALAAFRPEQYRSQRVDALGMRGSMIGLVVGSSLIVAADTRGYYELGRSLELNLQRRMTFTDRIHPDLFVSSIPAATIPRAVGEAIEFMQLQFIPDFVVIEANELVPMMAEPIRNGRALEALLVLKRLSEKQGFQLFVMDDSVLGGRGRDGLLPRSLEFQKFLRTLNDAGIETLEPLSPLLQSHLDVAPWGNLPHRESFHHGSPQAIDRTADQLASLLAPRLASRFDAVGGRRDRTRLARDALVMDGGLRSAVVKRGLRGLSRIPRIPVDVTRVRLNGAQLEVLVDVGKLKERNLGIPASAKGLRSVVRTFVLEDVRGRVAEELIVKFVRFESYDEYGRGNLGDWESVYEARLTKTDLGLLD